MTFKRFIQGIAVTGLLAAGLWGLFRMMPTEYWNIRLAEAATQIYPKDNTTFVQIPSFFRGTSVKDTDLTTPPGSPAEGDRYIVASVATDTWAGKETQIAEWHARSGGTAQWYFIDPWAGYQSLCTGDTTVYVFDGATWVKEGTVIGAVNHATLSNLSYAAAGHTGFEPTVTKGNLTESTSSVLTIVGGTGAVIGTGTTIQVKQAGSGQSGYLSNSDWTTFNNKLSGSGTSGYLARWTPSGTLTLSTDTDTDLHGAGAHKTTEDAINGLVKVDGAGNYSAVTDNSGNWDNAYGWGDHSLAGYLVGPIAAPAQGDLLYFDTDKWKSLAAGDSGKYLKTQGPGANPIWDTPPGSGDMEKADYATQDNHIVDTAFQISITSQAAGDILYYDGEKWVRLAKDAGKYLKSGASAVSWDTPPGSGTVTGTGTAGMMAKWTDTGEIGDASSNDTDVADAVSKKHTQSHDITSPTDHTSSATPSQILMADANGLPVDSNFTDTEMRTKHIRFTVMDPNTLVDTTIFVAKPDAAITVTNLHVSCLLNPDTEIAGDLKYCDNEITMANPVVVNDFDTTAGERDDNSITSAAVAATKCIYIDFDATPIAAIKEIFFDITYTID